MSKWIAAAFVAVLVSSGAAAQEDCRLTLAASLPMEAGNPHRVIIPAEIDGKPLHLMIDTGSGMTGLSEDAVARLGIKPFPISIERQPRFPYGGGNVTQLVQAANFKLGGMTAAHTQLMVLPRKFDETDGLLGADFLKQFDVEFDFAGGKVNLFAPHPCSGKVVYWTQSAPVAVVPFQLEHGHIRVEYDLDGHRVPADLDTGAPNTSISMTTAKAWFNLDENSPGMKDLHRGAFRYHFKALSLNGITVQDPDILIHAAAEGGHTIDFKSLLGINILSQLHLYVAYAEHKLYVTSATAH